MKRSIHRKNLKSHTSKTRVKESKLPSSKKIKKKIKKVKKIINVLLKDLSTNTMKENKLQETMKKVMMIP